MVESVLCYIYLPKCWVDSSSNSKPTIVLLERIVDRYFSSLWPFSIRASRTKLNERIISLFWSNYPNAGTVKKTTLNYPILFGYLRASAKFSCILHERKIFSEHFILHLAMVSLLLWLENRVKHCQIFTKKTQVRKYYIFMKYPRKFD